MRIVRLIFLFIYLHLIVNLIVLVFPRCAFERNTIKTIGTTASLSSSTGALVVTGGSLP